jgi:hypothetical protein
VSQIVGKDETQWALGDTRRKITGSAQDYPFRAALLWQYNERLSALRDKVQQSHD